MESQVLSKVSNKVLRESPEGSEWQALRWLSLWLGGLDQLVIVFITVRNTPLGLPRHLEFEASHQISLHLCEGYQNKVTNGSTKKAYKSRRV